MAADSRSTAVLCRIIRPRSAGLSARLLLLPPPPRHHRRDGNAPKKKICVSRPLLPCAAPAPARIRPSSHEETPGLLHSRGDCSTTYPAAAFSCRPLPFVSSHLKNVAARKSVTKENIDAMVSGLIMGGKTGR